MDDQKYSIGYTSQFTALPQSVLRYWETVFKQLQPHKTPGGTRRYSQADIDLILLLKNLLYDRKFTIAGARRYLDKQENIVLKEDEQGLREYVIKELESILREIE